MKIAFVGKGGSGKTTLAALFSLYLKQKGGEVLTIDADINQHFGETLGYDMGKPVTLDTYEMQIKRVLRGENPRIEEDFLFMKTTPPGTGSKLLRVRDDALSSVRYDINGIGHIAAGSLGGDDIGMKCFHGKTGVVEILLNHLVEKEHEYVVVDMTAGADWFASGMFFKFDAVFIVVEPTLKSTGIYRQFIDALDGREIPIHVVANKVTNEDDYAYVEKMTGVSPVASFSLSRHIKDVERGAMMNPSLLEEENVAALDAMIALVEGKVPNYAKRHQEAVEFHVLNAVTWMNARLGYDFSQQIDPLWDIEEEVQKMFSEDRGS